MVKSKGRRAKWKIEIEENLKAELRLIANLGEIEVDHLISSILDTWVKTNEQLFKDDSLGNRLKGYLSKYRVSKPKRWKIRVPANLKARLVLISILGKVNIDRLLTYILEDWVRKNRKTLLDPKLPTSLCNCFNENETKGTS